MTYYRDIYLPQTRVLYCGDSYIVTWFEYNYSDSKTGRLISSNQIPVADNLWYLITKKDFSLSYKVNHNEIQIDTIYYMKQKKR